MRVWKNLSPENIIHLFLHKKYLDYICFADMHIKCLLQQHLPEVEDTKFTAEWVIVVSEYYKIQMGDLQDLGNPARNLRERRNLA